MRIILLLLAFSSFSTYAQQKSIHEVLNQLANKNQLDLCFSKDLVDLSDSIIPPADSLSFENYLKELALLTQLEISCSKSNLIVTSITTNTLNIKGRLVDMYSNEVVPFAHILQKDWGSGTITNDLGEFELNIPRLLAGYQLKFSSMGYSDTSIVIPSNDTTLMVKIRAKPYNLNEVLILPNGNSAKELVKQATKKIKRNYHRKTCQMEAFYRQTAMRDTTFVNLIEAALLIEDRGIDASSETTKIKVDQMRRSTNYLIPHDKEWQLATKVWKKVFGHRNVFYKCYGRNVVRHYKDEWWYRPLVDMNSFIYEFEGAMWMDTIKVYKIKYEYDYWSDDWGPKPLNKEKKSFDGGYIYINSADLAIIQLDNIWQFKENHPYRQWRKDGIFSKSTRSYQKINGKYYLKYIKGHTYPNAKSWIPDNPDLPASKQVKGQTQWAEEVLLITNVITDKKQQERIKIKEKLDREEKTLEKKYPYNPDFWATYNTLVLKPLPGIAIKNLEWEKSLEIQFKENGSNDITDK